MLRTRNTASAGAATIWTFITVLALVGAVLVVGRLTTDDPNDRVITLATSWGDGQGAAPAAYIRWSATSRGSHVSIVGGGHWEKLVVVRKGDRVTLGVSPSLGPTGQLIPASCSIRGFPGIVADGTNDCIIARIP